MRNLPEEIPVIPIVKSTGGSWLSDMPKVDTSSYDFTPIQTGGTTVRLTGKGTRNRPKELSGTAVFIGHVIFSGIGLLLGYIILLMVR